MVSDVPAVPGNVLMALRTVSSMRVSAESQTCAVSSLCVYRAPQVFDQDKEEGTVVVIDPQPSAELHEAVLSAERACPTRSIHVDRSN